MTDQQRTIELSVLATCPVRCAYCPQDVLRAATRARHLTASMTVDTLSAVLRNAADGDARGLRVSFAGFTEPFKHPHATELVAVCDAFPGVQRIVIFTTGEGLTTTDIDRLATFGKLARVTFHVDAFGGPQRALADNLWPLLPAIVGKLKKTEFTMIWDTATPSEVLEVERHLRPFGVVFGQRVPHSRSGNIARLTGTTRGTLPVTCPKMQEAKAPVVLPDGSCVACANDYGLTLPIGNLRDQTWSELNFADVVRQQSDPSSGAICFCDCNLARPLAHGQRGLSGTAPVK